MAVVQTAGAPPILGRTSLAKSGWTKKSRLALVKIAAQKIAMVADLNLDVLGTSRFEILTFATRVVVFDEGIKRGFRPNYGSTQ
ncbi:hypothetical protein [Ruegeria sp. AD91A]|uniref:hypothetical protein n=1 Tax=Ruegeria sp. AD91A TaxID=2293862 RepID=UPI0020C7ABCD|nr:hypothetical protein [Ruegeria sp. AD91A]